MKATKLTLVVFASLLASPALACLPLGESRKLDAKGYADLAKQFLAQSASVDVVTPTGAVAVFDRKAREEQLRRLSNTPNKTAAHKDLQSHLGDPVGYRISLRTVEQIKGDTSPSTTTILGERLLNIPEPQVFPEANDFTVLYDRDGKLHKLETEAEQELFPATFVTKPPCWRPLTFTMGRRYLIFRDLNGHLINVEGLPQPLRKVDLSTAVGGRWYKAVKAASASH